MYSDKKLDTHCQKIRHLRFYVIFYLVENDEIKLWHGI